MRWAVLGCGPVAAAHVVALQQTDDAQIVGVADANAELVRSVADRLGVPGFTSVQDLLAESHPQAVTIALPNFLHGQSTVAAASAGAHVLCEKPLARSVEECRQMLTVCRTQGVQLGSILNYRGYRQTRWIRDRITSGELHPLVLYFDVAMARPPAGSWRDNPSLSGGGILLQVGIHYLDLLLWWLGDPLEVTCALDRDDRRENAATAILRFPAGVLAVARFSMVGRRGMPVRMEIEAEEGRLRMVGSQIESLDPELGEPPTPEQADSSLMYGVGHVAVIGEAARALAEGQPLAISGEEGLRAVALCERLYAADRGHTWLPWATSS